MSMQAVVESIELTSFQREQLEWKSLEAKKERDYQIELRKMDVQGNIKIKMIELDAATTRLKAVTRKELWSHALVALFKAPTYPLAIFLIFVLRSRGHEVPKSLDEFINV